MYFTNYLDRSNLANAYVSGMKEDLGFVGNQYNLINTVFTVGYVSSTNCRESPLTDIADMSLDKFPQIWLFTTSNPESSFLP